MINLKIFKQKTDYTCGPACLRMIFRYHGLNLSEREIAKISGTDESGTPPEKIVVACKKFGFDCEYLANSSFSKIRSFLDKKIPVIVDWFSEDDGHYSVVVKIDNKNIHLADPEIGKIRILSLEKFYRLWFDFSGNFLKSKDDLRIRSLIVILPK